MELIEKHIRRMYNIDRNIAYRMQCVGENRVAVIAPQGGSIKAMRPGEVFYSAAGPAFPKESAIVIGMVEFNG